MFLDVAYRATPARKLVAAQPEMQALAAAIGQSCHLVVIQSGEGLVIAREDNPGVCGFALRAAPPSICCGDVRALSCPPFRPTMRPSGFSPIAALGKQPIGQTALPTRLARVREDGFGLRESAVARGVTDISCPIFGFDGELLAALTVPFLELIDGSQLVSIDEARMELEQAAERISVLLGWQRRNDRE